METRLLIQDLVDDLHKRYPLEFGSQTKPAVCLTRSIRYKVAVALKTAQAAARNCSRTRGQRPPKNWSVQASQL